MGNKMISLKNRIDKLEKANAEDRVIFQVMDLLKIKYNGVQRYTLDEETIKLIDALVMDWIWLYDNGYSMLKDPREEMNQEDLTRYEDMSYRFTKFETFMQNNMSLAE